MSRKSPSKKPKETSGNQDILKLYIDGQSEFRKALINATTSISIQTEISRDVVINLKDLIERFDEFEERLVKIESSFSDNSSIIETSAVKNIVGVKDSAEKSLNDLKNTAVREISKKKMTAVIMFFFLALASLIGAYSVVGSKLKTELSTSGVSIEAKSK